MLKYKILINGVFLWGLLIAHPNAGHIALDNDSSFLHASTQVLFHSTIFSDFLKNPDLEKESSHSLDVFKLHMIDLEASKKNKQPVFSLGLKQAFASPKEQSPYEFFVTLAAQVKEELQSSFLKNEFERIFETRGERKFFTHHENSAEKTVMQQVGLLLDRPVGYCLQDIISYLSMPQEVQDEGKYRKTDYERMPQLLTIQLMSQAPQSRASYAEQLMSSDSDTLAWCQRLMSIHGKEVLTSLHDEQYQLFAVIMKINNKRYGVFIKQPDNHWVFYDDRLVIPFIKTPDIKTFCKSKKYQMKPHMFVYEQSFEAPSLSEDLSVYDTLKIAYHKVRDSLFEYQQRILELIKT